MLGSARALRRVVENVVARLDQLRLDHVHILDIVHRRAEGVIALAFLHQLVAVGDQLVEQLADVLDLAQGILKLLEFGLGLEDLVVRRVDRGGELRFLVDQALLFGLEETELGIVRIFFVQVPDFVVQLPVR